MPAITMTETLRINAIVWVCSLPKNELGPTCRILEDLEGLAVDGGLPVLAYNVADQAEFAQALNDIAIKAHAGLRPILHLDAHGTVGGGVLLAPSGEQVAWSMLIDHVRAINVATQNNLVCVFALCFGLHLYGSVALSSPVPAYIMFGPEAVIKVGDLESKTALFYREINRTQNVSAAFTASLKGPMLELNCQGLFLLSLVRYVRKFCMGKAKAIRVERLVTKHFLELGIDKPAAKDLKCVRAKIRSGLAPGQHIIDRFAPTFLIGRPAQFSYSQIEAYFASKYAQK